MRTTTDLPEQDRRAAPTPATPLCPKPARQLVEEALRDVHAVPVTPPWSHRVLPAPVRGLLADLGWWQNPVPQAPSTHLQQVLAVLTKYGWCQSLDTTITGRLCIRGAQDLLERTGHVTPQARNRAVHYLQQTLGESGIHMQFFAWNDLPDQPFSAVQVLLETASRTARKNGQ
ncbi:hypothetical protein ACIOEX_01475 [Streptomyces sp. NPDC087850]|uniref:DUF6197 family protein n=1 Tax=Streptomyces sp. NPDC087850 TaxID=3365809 RepID=UPI00381EC4B3